MSVIYLSVSNPNLICDEFTTARASGEVDGTPAEPGPGTRDVVQNDGVLTIADGALTVATAQSSAVYGDLGLKYLESITRAAGQIVMFHKYPVTTGVLISGIFDGTGLSYTKTVDTLAAWQSAATIMLGNAAAAYFGPSVTITNNEYYRVYFVLRSTGFFMFIWSTKKYSSPRLWKILPAGTTATMYPSYSVYTGAARNKCDRIVVPQITSPSVRIITNIIFFTPISDHTY